MTTPSPLKVPKLPALRDAEPIAVWHFPMMNDSVRNAAYEQALAGALKDGGTVLDIGAGSGLLAMLAARHGATKVISCEEIPNIASKATEIIRRNGLADQIQLINKRSTDLVVGKDLPERADVLVTEIFDDGLLGEFAFSAIEHARKNLLKPGAKLIPAGARVFCMALESQEIFENHRVSHAAGFDVSPFNEFSVNHYFGYHLRKMDYRPLSKPKVVFQFDFDQIPGDESASFYLDVIQSGQCHALAYWFELKMDDQMTISTAPDLEKSSCWKQAVQILETPQDLKEGDQYRIWAHHDAEAIWFTYEKISDRD